MAIKKFTTCADFEIPHKIFWESCKVVIYFTVPFYKCEENKNESSWQSGEKCYLLITGCSTSPWRFFISVYLYNKFGSFQVAALKIFQWEALVWIKELK